MSLKDGLCCWWKIYQPNDGRMEREIGQEIKQWKKPLKIKGKTDDCWKKDTEGKVVDEKPPDLEGILGGNLTPWLEAWGLFLFSFFAKAVKLPAALPSNIAGPNC